MSRSRRPDRKKHDRRPTPPRPRDDRPVVRITTPSQVVASLPLQLGYTPEESIVVQCCHEPRGRIGLTVRVDLPAPEHEDHLAEYVEQVVRTQQATRVVLLVYTAAPDVAGARPRAALLRRLTDAFSDIIVTEALLVRGDRFWSYVCDGPCCPREGTPVDDAADCSAVQVMRLEQLASGQPQLGTREDLERSLAGPAFLEAEEMAQRYEQQLVLYADALEELGLAGARSQARDSWRRAVREAADPRWEPPRALSAALGVTLEDRWVRDFVIGLWDEDDPAVRRVLEHLVRSTPAPYDAAVCAALAWVTYCEGGGTATSILVERSLGTDPTYSLALILRAAMQNAVRPEVMRELAAEAFRLVQDAA